MRDLHNPISAVNALNGATIATDTNTDGAAVDLQGYDSCEFVARLSARTDGSYALAVLESDASGSGFAAAPATSVLGPSGAIAAANGVATIGYIGTKRYAKLRVVSTGTTSGAHVSAIAVKSRGRHTGGKAV